MPRFQNAHPSVESRVVLPTKVGNQYVLAGARSDDAAVEPEFPHPKATVDARPGVQQAAYETYWFDPNAVGPSPETIYYQVNPAPTKTTTGTAYTQQIYYRFTVGTGSAIQTYQYKKTIYWLKGVEGTTPDEPWLASSDEYGDIYRVDFDSNLLVDKYGTTKAMEPVI